MQIRRRGGSWNPLTDGEMSRHGVAGRQESRETMTMVADWSRWATRAACGVSIMLGGAVGGGGCHCRGIALQDYEEFVPVELSTRSDEEFEFHPEYFNDPKFQAGIVLVLWGYQHDFAFVGGKLMVPRKLLDVTASDEVEGRSVEMEYRANLTSKAFGQGAAYFEGLSSKMRR